MNRALSFSISLAGHVSCVWLLLQSSTPEANRPVLIQPCRVTLFAPREAAPPGASSNEVAKSPAPKPVVKKAQPRPAPKPTPKPVVVERPIARRKPAPEPERFQELPRLTKLERESLPPISPTTPIPGSETTNLSVSGGIASSYDAYIAGAIKSNWVRPSRPVVGENPPAVSVAIQIAIDGKITRSQMTRSSGIALLDASALKAIERSNPLSIGLPGYMGCRYYDVTIVFRITDEA